MSFHNTHNLLFLICFIFLIACSKKKGCTDTNASNYNALAAIDDGSCCYENTPTFYNLEIPSLFSNFLPIPNIPSQNPFTVEGIALGKQLFYDPILSSDKTISCASCHSPETSFSDNKPFSSGVNNKQSTRHSMPLFNLAWHQHGFFWDGRSLTLEDQIFHPVTNPNEMNDTWVNVVQKLNNSKLYPDLFQKAFGKPLTDSTMVSMAIAQFLRTLISSDSKFDRHLSTGEPLTAAENRGMQIFMSEKGDCFHCHGSIRNPLFLAQEYANNGLDTIYKDLGRFVVTKNNIDKGSFKIPSVRNLSFSAPYMHDGRFVTLQEVIDHYSDGIVFSSSDSRSNHQLQNGGMKLNAQEKNDLIAFLLTLNDSNFIKNKSYLP